MARATDKPKKWKKIEEQTENKWEDPNPDFIGFDRCSKILGKKYTVFKKDGILYVYLPDFLEHIDSVHQDVQKILEENDFRGSWGITSRKLSDN